VRVLTEKTKAGSQTRAPAFGGKIKTELVETFFFRRCWKPNIDPAETSPTSLISPIFSQTYQYYHGEH